MANSAGFADSPDSDGHSSSGIADRLAWEWAGAALFAVAGALYAIRMLPRHPGATATIALPLLVIAGLFLANWVKRAGIRTAHS